MSYWKHAPGPWLYDDAGITTQDGQAICEAPVHHPKSKEQWENNGPLLAAAPQMAELLRSILQWANNPYDKRGTSWFENEILDLFDEIVPDESETA